MTHDSDPTYLGSRTIDERADAPAVILHMWDTGRTDSLGKSILRYSLLEGTEEIFEGDDFACSPMHAIDSNEAFGALLSFLTLRPGDTDAEYFANYSERQLRFADERAESLSIYVAELEGTL